MKHEKTFDAIEKLKEVELELHRLKNALELANKGIDAQRTWVGLTPEEVEDAIVEGNLLDDYPQEFVAILEAKLKGKNT